MQVENPRIPGSGFTLDLIMHQHIISHKLVLTQGSTCFELSKWIAKKKAVINPIIPTNSSLNGLLLQHCIKKRLTKELACYGIMKIIATD